jgi:hypothetical protein
VLTRDRKLLQLEDFQVFIDGMYEFMMADMESEDIDQVLRDGFIEEFKELAEGINVPFDDLMEHCIRDKFGAIPAKYKNKNNEYVFIKDNEAFLQFWEDNS